MCRLRESDDLRPTRHAFFNRQQSRPPGRTGAAGRPAIKASRYHLYALLILPVMLFIVSAWYWFQFGLLPESPGIRLFQHRRRPTAVQYWSSHRRRTHYPEAVCCVASLKFPQREITPVASPSAARLRPAAHHDTPMMARRRSRTFGAAAPQPLPAMPVLRFRSLCAIRADGHRGGHQRRRTVCRRRGVV